MVNSGRFSAQAEKHVDSGGILMYRTRVIGPATHSQFAAVGR